MQVIVNTPMVFYKGSRYRKGAKLTIDAKECPVWATEIKTVAGAKSSRDLKVADAEAMIHTLDPADVPAFVAGDERMRVIRAAEAVMPEKEVALSELTPRGREKFFGQEA